MKLYKKSGKAKTERQNNELFRNLRTRILFNNPDLRTLTILSNDAGDGKTEIARRLAEALSLTDKKVLLIDGDLRHAELSASQQNKTVNGFDSLLKGLGNLKESIVGMNQNKLHLLPTTASPLNSTELLESDHLTNILDELKMVYDYIIIDTLSLREGTDAYLLSRNADGALFVTVENKTKSSELEEIKIILDEAGVRLAGAIMVS